MSSMDPTAAGPGRGGTLDSAPPQPPGGRPRSLMDNQRGPTGGTGLGAEAANPQVMVIQGMEMMQQGAEVISSALPALAPPLTGLIANLRQVIPQAMADQLAGVDATGAGAPGTGAGAVTPPQPPPPGPPPAGAVPGA